MVEKFSDFEGTSYIDKEGEFEFEIVDAELKDSSSGNLMIQLSVESDAGKSTLYHVLTPKARWSYNRLISACLKLTDEQKKTFELDYETIHRDLLGKKFIGVVTADSYVKESKVQLPDGTYDTIEEVKESFKIVEYKPAP